MTNEKSNRRQYPKKPRSRRETPPNEGYQDSLDGLSLVPNDPEETDTSKSTLEDQLPVTTEEQASAGTSVVSASDVSGSSEGHDSSSTSLSTSQTMTASTVSTKTASSSGEAETPSIPAVPPEEAARLLQQTKRPYAEWQILSEKIRKGIAEYGYVHPTPVQTAAIEPALDLNDMVVQAKTGTGKTAAFGIPLIERLEPKASTPRALILTPTRELAGQVATELLALAKYTGLQIEAVYGGTSIQNQIDALEKGVDIVVGTPGRVLDHIRRHTLRIDTIESIVLDEADEMLSMGFYLEVSSVIDACKNRKQLMLYSATLPPDIEGLIRQYTHKPVRLMVSGDDRKVVGIKHIGYFVQDDLPRPRNLLYVLEHTTPDSAIIFCNRRDDTSMLASYLARHGKSAEAIHGEMNQSEREKVLQKLRSGELQYMVATDVASRGIDISGLSHVINYNCPNTMDLYIHRVGRTGRQGREGTAISLLSGEDLGLIVHLKRMHKIYFDICELPPTEKVIQLAASRHMGHLFEQAVKEIIEPYLPLADAMQLDPRGRYIIAYFLKKYHEGDMATPPLPPEPQKQVQAETPKPPQAETPKPPVESKPEVQPPVPEVEKPSPAALRKPEPPSHVDLGVEKDDDAETDDESAGADIGEPNTPPGFVRLYINIGSLEGFQSDSLGQLISNELNLNPSRMTAIQVEKHHSFLNTDLETSEKILAGLQERKIGDFTLTAEIARKPRRRRRR